MNADDFAVEDYKLKLDYLKSHFDRLWIRFNFFLTIEVGLLGFLGWLVFEKDNARAIALPSALGIMISVLWWVVAAKDRSLVVCYRQRVKRAAELIERIFELHSYAENHVAAAKDDQDRFSITSFPVLVASRLLLILWITVLIVGIVCFSRTGEPRTRTYVIEIKD